ncbi:NAD-dependent protein deacetylase HST1 [Drosophila eugracilis]|uniref:NAD-dependent protein deacetylase HST1 n=1 Tax=Drosophila eugracilis TaxID=29029 RepID=UPI0007E66AD4|nr:NAD-dependent protein deacetylase HST1 [Drosophila eugracilis]
MSKVKKMPLKSSPKTATSGAGSPAEASSAAVASDASETERLVKLVMAMGYPEGEARLSLAQSNNNVQRAVQILVEGTAYNDDDESQKHRRSRQRLRKLRHTLMGDPLATDDDIVEMMRDQRVALAITEMVNGSSVQTMQLLLEDEEEEEEELEEEEDEEEEEEEEYMEYTLAESSSNAESSPASN